MGRGRPSGGAKDDERPRVIDLADSDSSPKPSARQASTSPSDVIRQALGQGQFRLLINLPPVRPCPRLEKLNATLEIEYLYADGQPVPKAQFVVETTDDSPVMAGPLNGNGHCRLTVPRGFSYQFYLQHDLAPDGTVFQFFDAYRKDPGQFADPNQWNPALLANGIEVRIPPVQAKLFRLKRAEDSTAPFVEYCLLHVASKSVPSEAVPGGRRYFMPKRRVSCWRCCLARTTTWSYGSA